jgi:hypothetical protein
MSNGQGCLKAILHLLAGPSGTVTTVYRPSMHLPGMMIATNCKNPEAAFRLGGLMCQQEYGITLFDTQGRHTYDN